MDYTAISQALVDGTAVVLTALVGLAVVYIKQYINKKVANDEFKSSLLATTAVIENSVNSSINNLSASAKVALADGEISREDVKMIEDNAAKHFIEQVSPEMQKRLEAHIGDVKTFVLNNITAQVEKANKVTGV